MSSATTEARTPLRIGLVGRTISRIEIPSFFRSFATIADGGCIGSLGPAGGGRAARSRAARPARSSFIFTTHHGPARDDGDSTPGDCPHGDTSLFGTFTVSVRVGTVPLAFSAS